MKFKCGDLAGTGVGLSGKLRQPRLFVVGDKSTFRQNNATVAR